MRNIIGAKHVITKDSWTLSLIRQKGEDHCFLVIEGVDAQGARVTKEAHLGWRDVKDEDGEPVLDEKQRPKKDRTKAEIFYFDTTVDKLRKRGENCYARTWQINLEQ